MAAPFAHGSSKNLLKFVSMHGQPQVAAIDYSLIRYSVTDGQPVREDCVVIDHANQQLQFWVGRKQSSKPADAFYLGLSDDEWLYSWQDMNFAFEGNFSVSFGTWGGEPSSYIVRMAQAANGAILGVGNNPWTVGGSGCSQSQCNAEFPAFAETGCLKCGKLCFQEDNSKRTNEHQIYLWPC